MRKVFRSLTTLLAAVGLATCSEAPTAVSSSGGGGADLGGARLAISPAFSPTARLVAGNAVAFALTFDSVRVQIRRSPDTATVVRDTTVYFPQGGPDTLTLALNVPARFVGEQFDAGLGFTSGGTLVYYGHGPVKSYVPGATPPATAPITINYTGPGARVARLVVSPRTQTLSASQTLALAVTAFDSAGAAAAAPPVVWSSSDTAVATVSGAGVVQARTRRGSATITARSPTDLTDAASIAVVLPAASIGVVSGAAQGGVVGGALANAAVVQVSAADGVGVAGVSVSFTPPTGGAVGTASAVTDASGRASTTLRLGTVAGAQVFTATAGDFSTTIAATASAGAASAIAIVSGNSQSDTVLKALAPLSVRVADSFGNGVGGATVTWTRATGTGALASATSVTSAEGLATNSYALGATAGAESVTAAITGASVGFTFTASSGSAAAIAAVSGSGQTGRVGEALEKPFVVRVSDASGNVVAGAAVAWSATNGTIVAGGATDAGGLASATLTLGTAPGAASATAKLANGQRVEFGATSQPGAAAQLVYVGPPSGGRANAALPSFGVALRDAAGNATAETGAVTLALGANAGGATLSGTTTRNAVGGIATFDDLRIDRAGTFVLVATSGALPAATSGSLAIVAGTAAAMTVQAGDAQSAVVNTAVATAPAVRVVDATGAPVAGVAVTFTPAAGSGSVLPAGGAVTTNGLGVATLGSWTLGTAAGTQTLTATTAGATSVTMSATATAAAAARVALTNKASLPAKSTSGDVLVPQPAVQVVDQFGNPVAGAMTVTASSTSGGITVGGTTTLAVSATTGAGTFTGLTLSGAPGATTIVVTPSVGTVSADTSNAIAVGSAAPLVLTANPAGAQSTPAGGTTPIAPSVTITQGGTAVSGRSVTFSTGANNGTISGGATNNVTSITLPATGGTASLASWTVPSAEGTYQLTATIDGTTISVTFSATVAGAHAIAFGSTPASAQVSGAMLSPQPTIQLNDGAGHNVATSGVVITASVAAAPGVTGASFSLAGTRTATTDASGLATFTDLAVSGTASLGARLTFSVTSGTTQSITPITRDVTLSAGVAASVGATSPAIVGATVGSALANGSYPAVLFKDAAGNVVPNAANTSVAFTVTSGSCSISGSPVAVDANGAAALSSSTLTVPASAGSCVVHAVTTPAISGSPFDFRVIAVPAGAIAWIGATDDDVPTASNWLGGVAPTPTDAVFIPRYALNAPKMAANRTVAGLTMESGSAFDLGASDTLTVNGSVDAATVANGAVRAIGSTRNIRGSFTSASLVFGNGSSACSYTLNGATTVTAGVPATSGNVTLSSCSLDVGGQTLTVGRNLTVTGANGLLVMQNASGKAVVAGAASFDGASTATSLTAGSLEIAGNFAQLGTSSATSFAPSAAHVTKLTGTAAQSVSFANPTSSHFYDLNVTNASASGTTIASIVTVTNDFTLGGSARLSGTFSGGGTRLFVGGAVTASASSDLGGLDSLVVTGTTFPAYANTTNGKAPDVTVLTGAAALGANATVAGGLAIGSGGSLAVGARTLTVKDSLIVDGALDMNNVNGVVAVSGLARFRGGSSSGHLQQGELRVGGDFLETGTSATAFAAPTGFLVTLNGTGSQQVSFDHPGAALSRFANLQLTNSSANGVSFASDVTITSDLEQKGRLAIGAGRTATVSGTASFRSGATTVVSGTLAMSTSDFYNGSSTTGTGSLTTSTCHYGSTIAGGDLLVGVFNVTSCIPGRAVLP